MIERCRLGSLPEEIRSGNDEGFVWEPHMPHTDKKNGCLGCIKQAQNDPYALREEYDTSARAFADSGLDPNEEHDRWQDQGIRATDSSDSARIAIKLAGLDFHTQSGSFETNRALIHFGCYRESDRRAPYELSGTECGHLYRVLQPNNNPNLSGRDNPVVRRQFYKPFLEGHYGLMVAAIQTAPSYITVDETNLLASNRQTNERVSHLLAMVADMPADVSIEHRLLVWQTVFMTDVLQLGERRGDTVVAIERMYSNEPEYPSGLVHRLEGVINAALSLKLSKLSSALELPNELSLEDLSISDPYSSNVYRLIRDHHPETLMLYKSIAALHHIRGSIRGIIRMEGRNETHTGKRYY